MRTGLGILITNAFIEKWTGSELYIRDVATQLINRGHKPVVYSPRIGELATVLRQSSIPVLEDLEAVTVKPDLIHGQHQLETMTALARFPGVPAIFVCHGWLPWEETPPKHPRILRYVTVSDAVKDRLIFECGIWPAQITTILNSVDLERFQPRPPLPDVPKRALVFSSYVNETNALGIIREACARNGLVVDLIGYSSGNPSIAPEALIGSYDIVFANGRAALESLAVGAAVICCGVEGAGPMVNTQNLNWLRRNNLGIRVHNRPLTSEILSAEIQHYDPNEAARVCREVRATAGLDGMVDELLGLYDAVLDQGLETTGNEAAAESVAFSRHLAQTAVHLHEIEDRATAVQAATHAVQAASRTEMTMLQAERDQARTRAAALEQELELIRGTWTWRWHQRLAAIPFVRAPMLWLLGLLRGRGADNR